LVRDKSPHSSRTPSNCRLFFFSAGCQWLLSHFFFYSGKKPSPQRFSMALRPFLFEMAGHFFPLLSRQDPHDPPSLFTGGNFPPFSGAHTPYVGKTVPFLAVTCFPLPPGRPQTFSTPPPPRDVPFFTISPRALPPSFCSAQCPLL